MTLLLRTTVKVLRRWVQAVFGVTASGSDLSLLFPQGDDWEDDEAVEAVKGAIDISREVDPLWCRSDSAWLM